MTAKEAFEEVLTINELLEELKTTNNGDIPNLLTCKVCDLLTRYRGLLDVEMKRTTLEAFKENKDD